MLRKIVSLTPEDGFRLRLIYDDGQTIVVDFTDTIRQGGVFAPLADPRFFAKAVLDQRGRAVRWPGDIDFCADALWLEGRSQTVAA